MRPIAPATLVVGLLVAPAVGASADEAKNPIADPGILVKVILDGMPPRIGLSLSTPSGLRPATYLRSSKWVPLWLGNHWFRQIDDIRIGGFVYSADGERVGYQVITLDDLDLDPNESLKVVLSFLKALEPGQQLYLVVEAWRAGEHEWEMPERMRRPLVEFLDGLAGYGPRFWN